MQFSFNYVNKNNEFFSYQISFIFLILFVSFFCPKLAKELAKFKDWTAFAEGEGKNLACMAVSKPKKSEGNYTKRGGCFCNYYSLTRTKKME